MTVSLEENTLVLAGESPFLYLFHLNEGEDYHYYRLPENCMSIKDLNFLREGRILILGEGMLYLLDSKQDRKVIFTKGIPGRKLITSFAINAQNKFLLALAESGEVYLFDFLKLTQSAEKGKFKRVEDISQDFENQPFEPPINHRLSHPDPSKSKPDVIMDAIEPREIHKNALTTYQDDPLKSLDEDSQPIGYYQYQGDKSFEKNYFNTNESAKKREDGVFGKSNINRLHKKHDRNFANISTGIKGKHHSDDSFEEIKESSDQIQNSFPHPIDLKNISKPILANWLRDYGVFPSTQRAQIWQYLLELPLNTKAFKVLQTKGLHPAYENLFKHYPRSELNENVLEILSCLTYHCENLSKFSFLFDFISPYVKIFGNEKIICFEIILSFLVHWFQHFIQNPLNPPVFLLQTVEKLLEYHEPYLCEHLKNIFETNEGEYYLQEMIWSLMRGILTDVLNHDDWLTLMDFLVFNRNQPKYFIYFVVAFLSYFKDNLLDENEKENILASDYFFDKRSQIDISKILEKTISYAEKTPTSLIMITFQNKLPLSLGHYPSLDLFVSETKDHYRSMEKYLLTAERKREERKEQLKEVFNCLEGIKQLGETFEAKQQPIAEQKRRLKDELIRNEEEKLKRKIEIEQESRNRKLERLKEMEEEMKKCLERQERMREKIWREMEREKGLKKQIEDEKIKIKMENEEFRQRELHITQNENELLELRQEQEKSRGEILDQQFKEREYESRETRVLADFQNQEEKDLLLMNNKRKKEEQIERIEKSNERHKENNIIGIANEFEKELENHEINRVNRLKQLKQYTNGENDYEERVDITRSFERRREKNTPKDHFVTRSFQRTEETLRSEDESFMGGYSPYNREDMLMRRRERMKILGEERESLQKDLEESRKRLKDLNTEKRKKEELRRVLDNRREEDRIIREQTSFNRSLEFDNEMQRQYLNRDFMEQQKKLFERTLKETEKRIIEQDKLNCEHLREATRQQMISFDEGPRRSIGSGRNNSFDQSREENRARRLNMSLKEEKNNEANPMEKKNGNHYNFGIF